VATPPFAPTLPRPLFFFPTIYFLGFIWFIIFYIFLFNWSGAIYLRLYLCLFALLLFVLH
jgi:hypothetical protein